jgi:hypothetical protein
VVYTPSAPPSISSPLQQQSQPEPETPQTDNTLGLALLAGPAEGSLHDIVESLLKLIDNKEENMELHLSCTASPIKLLELFDFTVEYWIKTAELTGSRGLQDELEFYELLDMDGSGEQDTDIMVDGMSEAILMSN